MDSELTSGAMPDDEITVADTDSVCDRASKPAKNPFMPDSYDLIFALCAFALGYMFTSMVFFVWRGWGVSVFTAAYLLCASAYLLKKDSFTHTPAAWFWFAVTLITGASYSLWDNIGIGFVRSLLLFCSAVYFVLCATDNTILGKTSNFLPLDVLSVFILIPFRNFFNQYVSFSVLKRDNRRKWFPIFLGFLLALLMSVWIIPLLERADSGAFSRILQSVRDFVNINSSQATEILIYAILAIPVAAYLFGLLSGAAHKRGIGSFSQESTKKAVGLLRFLQPSTVFIALGTICALYIVFILCQIPYLFSAFSGNRPAGLLVYSEYARKGFFELCAIAVINLAVITLGNALCKKRRQDSSALSALNILLALITLLLIAAAFSKMALYIGTYGLSILRLLPCVFMLFLSLLFIALIVLQKHEFSIVRFALVSGVAILCLLCVINPDAIVVRYNTDRYLSGTLSDYDTDILFRAGTAGVKPALAVYERTDSYRLRSDIARYLTAQRSYLYNYGGSAYKLSYEFLEARHALESAFHHTIP